MIEIKPQDIIIMHMQPENLGGWSVGVSKGITLYHKPSDTTISIDRYRSQHRNKSACLEVLQDLLTPFKDGDIVLTESGIGEITKLGFRDRVHYDLGDKNASNCWIELIAHTEEGYHYKNSKLIIKEIEELQDNYNRDVKVLRDKLKDLEKESNNVK